VIASERLVTTSRRGHHAAPQGEIFSIAAAIDSALTKYRGAACGATSIDDTPVTEIPVREAER